MTVTTPSRCLPCGGEDCACLHPETLPEGVENICSAVHAQFGLSYASYLVVPRSVLQSMPREWQARLVMMLGEMAERYDCPAEGNYDVRLKGDDGRFLHDPLADYDRGRRHVEPNATRHSE